MEETYLEDEAEEQDFCSRVPEGDGGCLTSAERDHCALGYAVGRQTLHLPATKIQSAMNTCNVAQTIKIVKKTKK